MGTEAGWTEKAKEDWTKFRRAFEAGIPDIEADIQAYVQDDERKAKIRAYIHGEKTPEEMIAKIREGRRQFMDYVEATYAGMPDSTLMEQAKGAWYMLNWLSCVSRHDLNECYATEAVLESRGYDTSELYNRWYVEAVAEVKAHVDAMVSEGEPLEGMVRAVVAEATNKETGEVDWARVDNDLGIVTKEGNGIDDATLARHGLGRGMDYWARKEVAAVIGSRDGFDAGRVIEIAAKTISPRNGGPVVEWIDVLRELRTLGYWDKVQALKESEFERQRALAAYLDEGTLR